MGNNKILTNTEMSAVDRFTIKELSISGFTLMETAGKSVYEEIAKKIKRKNSILIIAGYGNNSGDGFVVCRYLNNNSYNVKLLLLNDEQNIKGDAKLHFDLLKKTGFAQFVEKHEVNQYDYIIDAVFGTGFKGRLDESTKALFDRVNQSGSKIFSIDIASGLNGETGFSEGINANITVTIGAMKLGQIINEGILHSGEIIIKDIGFPKKAFDVIKSDRFLVTNEYIRSIFPKRNQISYKHQFGKVLVVGGLKEMSGAVFMTGASALKSGAGLVKVVTSEEVYSNHASKHLELMIDSLFMESESELNDLKYNRFNELCEWADVIVFGMGIGKHPIYKKLYKVLLGLNRKMIIDADGIDLIKNDSFNNKSSDVLITPHSGEFERLQNKKISETILDDLETVSKKYNVHCLLKGKTTIISTKDNQYYFDTNGNSALATAGSGDILSGLIAGFVAQTDSIKSGTIIANYLHGISAEIGSKKLTEFCFTATDILTYLPEAIKGIIND